MLVIRRTVLLESYQFNKYERELKTKKEKQETKNVCVSRNFFLISTNIKSRYNESEL